MIGEAQAVQFHVHVTARHHNVNDHQRSYDGRRDPVVGSRDPNDARTRDGADIGSEKSPSCVALRSGHKLLDGALCSDIGPNPRKVAPLNGERLRDAALRSEK